MEDLNITSRYGEKGGNHILTEAEVMEIKAYLAHPKPGMSAALARKYRVSQSCIYHIKRGKNWAKTPALA